MKPGIRSKLFLAMAPLTSLLWVQAAALTQEPAAPPPLKALEAAGGGTAAFQPYIFWAYGLACLLLGLFTLWLAFRLKALESTLEYLKRRLEDAHPQAR